jgi:5'(3')-deoxyribonucleotidase
MSVETTKNYLQTLGFEQRIFFHGIINLNTAGLVLDFDIDQVLADSEKPVRKKCDLDNGTNYSERNERGYNIMQKWLVEDGIMTPEDASGYEAGLWVNPKLLIQSEPNEALQKLSRAAARRNIPQFATTSRTPEVGEATYDWIRMYFPDIPRSNINQRADKSFKGEDYKALKVAKLYSTYPSLVHFDDSMSLMRKLLHLAPGVGIVGFPFAHDDISDIQGKNRVFIPDMNILNDLIYYS